MLVAMKRLVLFVSLLALSLLGISTTTASAASPHFKGNSGPSCTVDFTSSSSASTTCSGTLAGLGNETVVVSVTVAGRAVYTCTNQGGNAAAGQNKVQVGPVTGPPLVIPADQIKNGNLSFTTHPTVLTAPTTVTGAEAGCPNSNWTGVNPVLTVTSVTLVIEQPPGTVIFSCTSTAIITADTTFKPTC
jgi:hypothetical protein